MHDEHSTSTIPEATKISSRHGMFSSIQASLIGLLLLVLVPIMLSQAYLFHARYRRGIGVELQANLEIARAVGRTFHVFIHDILSRELAIGISLTWRDDLSIEQMNHILEENCRAYPFIRNFAWVNPQGRVIASNLSCVIGLDVSDLPDIKELVGSGKDWSASNLYLSKAKGEPIFYINRAIRDGNGTLRGIVGAGVDPAHLDDLFAFERAKGGGISIVDGKGMLVYRYPQIPVTWEERDWLRIYPSSLEEALAGRENVKTVLATYDGRMRIAAVTPISSIGWVAGAGRWEDEALGPIISDIFKSIAVVLLITLASFAVAFTLSRKISASIGTLRKHARSLGRGEYGNRINVSGPEELRDLAQVFNAMAEDIVSRQAERTGHLSLIEAELQAREKAQEGLRESEERFRTLVANIPDVIARFDKDLRPIYINPAIRQYVQFPIEEIIGKTGEELGFPEKQVAIWNRVLREVLRTGRPLTEEIHVCACGKKHDFQIRVAPEISEGEIKSLITVSRDITERKRADEALVETQRRLSIIVDSIADGFYALDNEFRFTHVNAAALSYFGKSRNAMIGRSLFELFPRVLGTVFEASYRRAMQSGKPEHFEALSVVADRVVQMHAYPGPGNLTVLFRDVTERKKMEEELRSARDELEIRVAERTAELERANEELRSFPSRILAVQEEERKRLAVELHDSIGQTLAALKFRIETVLLTRSRGDLKEALQLLDAFVPILQRSIDETRSIYTGLRPKSLEELGLLATIEWFCREFVSLHPKHHVELEMKIDEEEIPADLKIVIFRIAQEALNNIAKHSRAEWVDLSLLRNGEALELTITDDGVGMDLEYILKSSTASSLGLTGMRERAELTAGTFSILSAPGEGTTVHARWPLHKILAH